MAKKIKGLALTITTVLLSAIMPVSASAAEKKVRLTTDGQSVYYQTTDNTVEEFFKSNNISFNENYKVSVDENTAITDGMQITVISPKKISVSVNGGAKKFEVETQCETIGQLMLELKDKTGTAYKVADGQSSSEKLKNGSIVNLRAVKEEYYTETEEIPFVTIEEPSDTLFEGEKLVKQKGETGTKLITMKTIFYGDEQVDNFCIDRTVTKEAVNEIILVGTKKRNNDFTVTPSALGADFSYSKVVTMNATAYCPCAYCNGCWAGQPSTMGLKVQKGIVAVDPSFIPLGTKLYVEGYGFCIAADTGGAIKGNRIDLCYNSHSEALSSGWGHTNTKVYILN